MNYSRIIRKIAGIAMGIGFILILGSVGRAELADIMHEHITLKKFLLQIAMGFILMIPGLKQEWWGM